MVFCIGLATMKYQEGLVVVGIEGSAVSCPLLANHTDRLTGTVVPKPVESWTTVHRRVLRALFILFSFSWALEMYCLDPPSCNVNGSAHDGPFF